MYQPILNKDSLYFYTIKSTVFERPLCMMEMKYLFQNPAENGCLLSHNYVNPCRSAFIKYCISVIYIGNTLENIVEKILKNSLSYEGFKVHYINDENVPFKERRKTEYIIGYNINGKADMHNPKIILGITKFNDMWIFGELIDNKTKWQTFNHKPYSYSNALGVRTARALCNIAVSNNLSLTLVDPCCGVGTVVLEALSMGINVKGFELNPLVAENAKKNLKYFGYEDVITNENMHNINEKFDSAVVDMPYGLFSITTLKDQLNIIKTTRRIASRAVFITYEDMEDYFLSFGFKVLDKCLFSKGSVTRYITLCSD